MNTYLHLRQRAAAYRNDPDVHAAMQAAGVTTLTQPTLNAGETLTDLRTAPDVTDFDPDTTAEHGYGFVQLNQLALEHLIGART